MKSEEIFQEEQHYLAPGAPQLALLSRLVIREGKGSILIDEDGKQYIDFVAGIGVSSLGHAHPKYVAALTEAISKAAAGSYTSENRMRLLKLIAQLTPGDLNRTLLFSGGAEAVEAAVRLARAYTKKFEILAFWGGFHGKTGGVLGLIGDQFKMGWGPTHPGLHLTPYADCYRCAFGLSYPECGMFCLDFARKVLNNNTTGSLAAILVETIQGTAGNVVPPPEFIPGLQQIAREHDALLIGDEMITGFGRTGTMFGCEHTNTVPDIMTVGKGMGNGLPLSGLISTSEITSAKPFSKASSGSSSYGGNALASSAGLITIRTIVEDSLPENAEKVGNHMIARLQELQERFPFIGWVQGKGLMIRVELVKDRKSREPLDSRIMEFMFKESIKRGLVAMDYKASFRINPPLSITREEADQGLEIFAEVCQAAADTLIGRG
jgi:4-aminobutyrate aminotransferase / (S)-3-amino-2-methylpropionate transaminase / 5-aminovalerate transaminase